MLTSSNDKPFCTVSLCVTLQTRQLQPPNLTKVYYIHVASGLKILSRYFLSKLRVSGQRPSSVDNRLLVLLSNNGADPRMDSFSCKQSLQTLSLGANGFTFLTTSHLMLKLMFLFFSFPNEFAKCC